MSEKRKIIFVAHHLTIGGAQKSLIAALNAIDYSQNDVTLYLRKNRTALLGEVNKNVDVIINEDKTRYYRKLYAIVLTVIYKLLLLFGMKQKSDRVKYALGQKIRVDMMHTETKKYFADKSYDVAIAYVQGYSADIVALGIKAEKKHFFYHSSTDESHSFHESIFPYFDSIVAVNAGVKNMLSETYPDFSDKITVLENYVDYKAVREKAVEFIPERAKLTLCTCGRIEEVKGFDLAVGAAEILKNTGLEFIWYFVGDGTKKDEIQKLIAEKNLTDNIKITGMQSNPYPYINACDIYVQTSRAEAQGIVIVEAQILSKPVVSTLTVGGKSMVKDNENGLLAGFTPESIAEKIIELSDENLRAAFAERIKKIDFSAEEKIYKERIVKLLS